MMLMMLTVVVVVATRTKCRRKVVLRVTGDHVFDAKKTSESLFFWMNFKHIFMIAPIHCM